MLIVTRGARLMGVGITEDGAMEIARRSRGTPRIAGRLLRRVVDFALVAGDGQITAKLADAALLRLDVDKRGLDMLDRRYLNLIVDHYDGGPVGIETIAAALSEPRDAIEEIVEPYPVAAGLHPAHPARPHADPDRLRPSRPPDAASRCERAGGPVRYGR